MTTTPTRVGALLLACLAALASPVRAAAEVHGAGATFPSAVYKAWASGYEQARGAKVSYQPTGSGDGIKRIEAREVDFGASDSALSQADLESHGLLQIPSAIGGIVPVVNLRGVANERLRLTGELLADIMRGAVDKWNDRRIAALNPDVDLPPMPIVRVVRAEKSGTNDAFTRYLSLSSPEWKQQVGAGQLVKWPGTVTAVDGNDGVARTVAATAGAIGYVSYDRVAQYRLAGVRMRNRAGSFVSPSPEGFRAAVKESDLNRKDDETATLLDQPGPQTWPLTITTYLLLDVHPKTAEGARGALQFVWWSLLNGDGVVRSTGLTPMPETIQARLVQRFARIKPQDGQPLNFYDPQGR
ncbi:MAG: phosphate ABC transporter substrate-binding protein PstS [Burkholderiaceae bacterium]